MESNSQAGNLISHLPEIISKIMGFLPTTNLETASLVNTTWQMEALKHLIARNPIDIHATSNVTDSPDLVTLTNLSPTNLKIITLCFENWDMLLPKIDLLISLNLNTVTQLSIELPLDAPVRHVASRLVKMCESFKNLESLEFQPIEYRWQGDYLSEEGWVDLFPDNLSLSPKLVTFSVNMTSFYPDRDVGKWEHVIPLVMRILAVFAPRVRKFAMTDFPIGMLVERNTLPNLESLSFSRTFHLSRNNAILEHFKFSSLCKKKFENVTRFEFNTLVNDPIPNGVDLFHILAPQLEHVCISNVENISPRKNIHVSPYIVIPILPRLKIFEILREPTVFPDTSTVWFRPFLYLKFETGGDEVKLEYGKQFPVLEKLIVRVVSQNIPKWRLNFCKKPKANLQFEATMLFLYETFLAEGLEPCETLRSLDISFPTRGKWDVGRLRMKKRCECEEESEICKCWGWREDFPDFYERISRTFPNLNYDVVEEGKRNVREEKIKKFEELRESLGFVKDKEGKNFKKKLMKFWGRNRND